MPTDSDRFLTRARTLDEKCVYTGHVQEKLSIVKALIAKTPTAHDETAFSGRFVATADLEPIRRAVAANLAAAEDLLDRLSTCNDEEWNRYIADMESSWEDLARSFKWLLRNMPD